MNNQVTQILASELLRLIEEKVEKLLIIDSRSFLEYNDSHIIGSINIQSSKLIRKRLEQNKLNIMDLLKNSDYAGTPCDKIIICDQSTNDIANLSTESFLCLIAKKLCEKFSVVLYLKGGFAEFGHRYPKFCERKQESGTLLSISTPCMSCREVPVTKILPFLYLGNAEDSQDIKTLQSTGIDFVMNVSETAADSPHVITTHYLKIPVRDTTSENIVDWFQSAFDFIDRVRSCDGRVLVHCVGGVSRSATIAVGYVMRHMQLSLDNAYRFVKDKRPTISPNLNFMGQLLQYEKQLAEKGEKQLTEINSNVIS